MHFRLVVEQPKSREIVNYISKPPRGVRVGRMRVRDASVVQQLFDTGRVASKVAHETECDVAQQMRAPGNGIEYDNLAFVLEIKI